MLNPQRHCYRCRNRARLSEPYCPRCAAPLLIDGRYRIDDVLGKGGWGIVYAAEDQRLKRRCAIKAVPTDEPHQRDALEAEWRHLRDHATELLFIPSVYDVVRDSTAIYLVMELIVGNTLVQVVARDGPWHAGRVEEFVRALLVMLARLHKRGLIHRDLKPQNIMLNAAALGPERCYVLLDFGIARRNDEQTQYYGRGVSLPYSPPEQRSGQPTDCRSDLFSLAATACHLLTGDAPPDIVAFLSATPDELIEDLRRAQASPALGHTLLHMLQLSPDDRPGDAAIALAMLDADWPPLPATLPIDRASARANGVVEETLPAVEVRVLGRGRAYGLSWSADGRQIAVAAATGAYVYDAESMGLLRALATEAPARQATFLCGGEQLLVAAGAVAQIWRVRDWSVVRTLRELPPGASLAPAPDGRLIAVVSDGLVRVRSTRDGAPLYSLESPFARSADAVAFAPDGQMLATAAPEGVTLWRADDGARVSSLQTRLVGPVSLSFAPDGQRLGVMDRQGLRLWDRIDGALIQASEGLPGAGQKLLFAPSGEMLATVERGGVRLWQVVANGLAANGPRQPGALVDAAFGRTDQQLAVATGDGIELRHGADGRAGRSVGEHAGRVQSIAFSPDGQALAAASGSVRIWSVGDRSLQQTLGECGAQANGVAYAPDGRLLAVTSQEEIVLWRTKDWTRVWAVAHGAGQTNGVVFSCDGQQLIVAGAAGVQRWRVADGALVASCPVEQDDLYGIALAPDGTIFATITGCTAQRRRVSDGSAFGAPIELSEDINGAALAPGGALLALLTDTAVLVWREDELRPLLRLEQGGHYGLFSEDGRFLATSAAEHVWLWSLEHGSHSLPRGFHGHSDAVGALAFSADGRLASAGWDGTIRLY